MDKTIYRIYPSGDKYVAGEVIALFPQIAGSVGGALCMSYSHFGQHSAATPQLVINRTRLATPKEYAELHKELKRIGYNPRPAKKMTWKDYEIRREQYKPGKAV